MKFKIADIKDDAPVVISLEYDTDGEPVVTANGVPLLYVLNKGRILLNDCDGAELQDMGFEVDDCGSVKIGEE